MSDKKIVVIYHKRCPDGFGAAYAAWKKFGDTAEYIPASYGDDALEGLEDKEVYLLDFSYELPGEMERLAKITSRFVALDHHQSSKHLTEIAPEHVYDEKRSGASIAWAFFHPDMPLPRLIRYLEDGDLYRYALPETRDVFSYLVVQPDDFPLWDALMHTLEDDTARTTFLITAAAYTEYFELLAKISVEAAKKVSFEGVECYFSTAMPSITMRSYVGHELYKKLPPIALIVSAHPDGFGVSIRGDGSIDVSAIAQKYGGGGHPNSAGFFIPNGASVPWVEIED
jgi:oligoribonuclease NrnB/cAMP/cGMP phosphodiesterase (DHH superfamily)